MASRTVASTTAPAYFDVDARRIPGMLSQFHGSREGPLSSRSFPLPHETSYGGEPRLTAFYDPTIPQLRSSNLNRHSPPSPRDIQHPPSLSRFQGDQGSHEAVPSEYGSWESSGRLQHDYSMTDSEPTPALSHIEYSVESTNTARSDRRRDSVKYHTQRKPSNRDEFDGPHQLLNPPSPRTIAAQERELLHLPTNLDVRQQDEILSTVNDILSKCAFDFVAKYQFPIPLEADKRQVRSPSDREWTEWVYLLKRLATKRRIPARVLYNNQIKQLVTILENSLEMRHAAKHQSRPLKDDRNILQLISAGTQVAKILKDATAMDLLDQLYVKTEAHIQRSKEMIRRGGLSSIRMDGHLGPY
jgi:hypothetical protein